MPLAANNETLKPMIDAALKAAHIALLRRKENLNVKQKEDGSNVTAGDYQSQQIIKAELEKASPAIAKSIGVDSIGFLMEESIDGDSPNFAARNQGAHWVVDPVDGTHGYSRKLGEKAQPWAISIALEKDGKTIAAAVYEAAPNEFGTTQDDFNSIDPTHPQGTIFIAHSNAERAYRLDGKDGGFTITEPKEGYQQTTRDVANGNQLPVLAKIPKLTVDFSRATKRPLTGTLQPGAKPYIDGFYQDGATRNTASQTHYKQEFITKLGLKSGQYDDCYSAVAGAMLAADGRVSTYFAGRCYAWDASAARLILKKSGTPFIEYPVGDGSDQRTMLMAGRDKNLLDKMKKTIEEMRDDKGAPIVNTPLRRGFIASTLVAMGAALKSPSNERSTTLGI